EPGVELFCRRERSRSPQAKSRAQAEGSDGLWPGPEIGPFLYHCRHLVVERIAKTLFRGIPSNRIPCPCSRLVSGRAGTRPNLFGHFECNRDVTTIDFQCSV